MCRVHWTISLHRRQIAAVSQQLFFECPVCVCVRHCSGSGPYPTRLWIVGTQQMGVEKVLSQVSDRRRVWAGKEPEAWPRVFRGYWARVTNVKDILTSSTRDSMDGIAKQIETWHLGIWVRHPKPTDTHFTCPPSLCQI